ncbi:MAG: thiol-disulfide isomerase [Acidobacteria bacterium]|nr:thiol-disulfide isomerase [Acidobacteriota bacterium]
MAAVLALPASGAEVTFYKDVLLILQQRCQTCHRPGEIGPMALETYKDTRPWAKAIREAVILKRMPPWHADSQYGRFRNDLSLPPREIETLVVWVDGGAREGEPADAPPPRRFTQGWRIPQPDAVFELPEEVRIPASGTLDYQYYSVSTHFTEDRWVEMAEVRPGNRAVVHHAIVMVQDDTGFRFGRYLAGYAPGMSPQTWKPGQARLIPAGSALIFQMHYTANGKAGVDRSRIGLVFAKRPPESRIVAMSASNHWLAIPPGAANHRVEASTTVTEPLSLVGMRPHMHLRGRSFEFRAVYPTGESQVLLRVPRYDFNWQPYYYLEQPILLPPGTRIECTAHYDNSANNPRNPDPNVEVHWGEQSWDEMMLGWFDVAISVARSGSGLLPGRSAATMRR